MKKFLKVLGISIITLIVLLYLAFLFVLPRVVDLNSFKPTLQRLVREETNLNLSFKNPKLTVTPLLSVGVTAYDISVTLPDDSYLFEANTIKAKLSLPSLLLLTVKVPSIDIYSPYLTLDIADGKAFKVVQALEEVLNKKEEKIEENLQTAQKPFINPADIKIMLPSVVLHGYNVKVRDLETRNTLKLRGDKLALGYKNGKTVSVKTEAELYLNDVRNITAYLDIDTFLPQSSKLDEEDDEAQRVEIPFVNPVEMYMAYDLKTNIDSKIKIRQRKNQIVSNGYFYVDDFTLKLADMQLPKSKFHFKSRGTKADIDTDLYITDSELIQILGMFDYSKRPKMDMQIKSNEIYTNDVINLIRATLDSLHIKHELQPIKGEGHFIIDTKIKTNFKKLESQGDIKIVNCIIKDIKKKLTLAKVNSVISLNDSILKFIDTSVEIADTVFKIDGSIDDKSYADINVFMEKMPVKKIFSMFLPSEINNVYAVNSGNVNLTANIKGELKKAIANLKLSVQNLSLTDKINKINYNNNLLVADFNSDFKVHTGTITNSDFKLSMNGVDVDCEKFVLNIGEKDIVIEPSDIKINKSTTINFAGDIANYIKKPVFNFKANGDLITKDLKKILGPDMAIFINEKGKLPLEISLNGDSKKQTFKASIEADKDNYITAVDIQNVLNEKTRIQTVVDFKGDRLKIKDTGFYIKREVPDEKDPEKTIVTLEEVASVDGTITKLNTPEPNINLIKIKMPKDLSAKICAFPDSSLMAKGNMLIFGSLTAPRIRGEFDIWNLSIPELLLTMKSAAAKFESKDLTVDINQLVANGSDYDVIVKADLNPSKNFVINNLTLISKLTDADKLMKVSDLAMKYAPKPQPSNANAAPADIPVVIQDGSIDIKQIKTGNILLADTTAKIALANNIFYVNNLLTSGFKGKIRGDVSMNLVTSEIKAVLKGNGLDVEKALLDAANMKDTLTGTMDFNTDISLKGATYEEQMKSLKGSVNFAMKNGQLGPFGRLENLIMAENIRESAFLQSTIGSVLNSLLSFDTSRYNELKGELTFADGITYINPITSQGNIMAAHIFGDFNLLTNKIDIKFRGRLGSQVSDSLGPISLLNPVNLVKATPGTGLVLGKIFFLFCESVTPDELNIIPSLGKEISDANATKFQVVLRGNVEKPLTLVKSFKWLALQSEIDNVNLYLESIPEETMPLDITNINPDGTIPEIPQQAKKILSLFRKNK